MTQDDYLKIKEGFANAQTDVTPFPVVDGDGGLAVVGDANKTEIKKNDYKIQFRLPNGIVPEGVGHVTEMGTYLELEYKDIFITPRQEYDITKLLIKMQPFFNKVDEEGNLADYTNEEVAELLFTMNKEITNLMYELVAEVCGVDPVLKKYMRPESVVVNTYKICKDIPNAINEADSFFGKSVQKA